MKTIETAGEATAVSLRGGGGGKEANQKCALGKCAWYEGILSWLVPAGTFSWVKRLKEVASRLGEHGSGTKARMWPAAETAPSDASQQMTICCRARCKEEQSRPSTQFLSQAGSFHMNSCFSDHPFLVYLQSYPVSCRTMAGWGVDSLVFVCSSSEASASQHTRNLLKLPRIWTASRKHILIPILFYPILSLAASWL